MKKHKLIIILLCCLLLSGCWDKIEIDDRLFVLAFGIDKATEEEKNNIEDRYTISFVSPIVKAMMEGGENTFHTYKTVSDTVTMGLNQMYERFSKKLSFSHTRVAVLGEDVLKDERLFKEAMDSIGRSPHIHKTMNVFVVPGRAEEVFKVKPMYSTLLAVYIKGISENELYQSRVSQLTASDLGINMINNNGSSLIPRLIPFQNEVKVSGMGIIKEFKLIGYLSEEEGEYANWINNKAKGGLINTKYQGVSTPFRYNEFKSTIKLDRVEQDRIYLTYNMETEGAIEEYLADRSLLSDKILRQIEKQIENYIVENSEKLISKFQNEYKVDLIGASEYLSKYQPKLYSKIEKDYEENFLSNIIINVKATAKIRRVGVID